MFQTQMQKMIETFNEYPRTFWKVILITFIDRVGGALIFPFFALYLTSKFNVGMADVGILFATFSLSSFVGNAVGGALTDRFGRKKIIIFGLIASSFSLVAMGFAASFQTFFVLALFIGILTDVAGPAREAMIADILPEEKRAAGYGILRIAFNLSITIGPAIGGLLAGVSYLLLFISDAVISLLTVVLVATLLPETKPQRHADAPQEAVAKTFAGYGKVFRDLAFMLFLGFVLLQVLAYMNMNTTLGVYLRNQFGTPASRYGLLLSINAAMVVLFQFPITRRVEKFPPMLMMAVGTFLYAIGFSMYGYVSSYTMFIVAMVVITIGEMIVAPVQQALTAKFAPEEMRGRYMAVAGLAWGIPFMIGPYLAGLIIDGPRPELLWYIAGFIGLLSAFGFLNLNRAIAYRQGDQTQSQVLPDTT
ncbi:MAG TPA: MFS transporter [Anaerolineales bacterium]|nr:MFS transporter [Anaerolineales bacterium]HMS00850.1 MFS transporter [Anaerolineales bacterium]HNS60477.1 MFS transporter [Anaerolineales bacterium]